MKPTRSNLPAVSVTSVVLGLLGLALQACADAKGMEPIPTLNVLQVLPASGRLDVGDTTQLGAQRIEGPTATNVTATVTWTSDNESVLKVSYDKEAGAVATAVGPGTAHITADDKGVSAKAEFVVSADVSSLELDLGVFELAKGTSRTLGATLVASDGSKRALTGGTWGSSDPAVASVTSKGVVTGAAPGEALITLTRQGLTTSQTVFVRDWALESIDAKVVGGTKLLAGGGASIKVTGQFAGGHSQDITSLFTFKVEQPDPAKTPPVSVTGAKLSAGDEAGTATVTGAGKGIAAGKNVTFDLTVLAADTLTALKIDVADSASTQGEILPFTVTGTYGDVELETTPDSFATDKEGMKLAYVDKASGTVTPLAAGTVTLTATTTLAGDPATEDDDKEIKVTKALRIVDAALSGVTVAPASDTDLASVDVGKTTTLGATAAFGSDVTQDVSEPALWTSSDPTIAVVSNVAPGKVTGVKAGKATIKATYKKQSGTFEITVK